MSYDPGALNAALAAAIGDDPALKAELRAAFLEGVRRQADHFHRARRVVNGRTAAGGLQGIAASFGATDLMEAAEAAATGAPSDPVALRRIGTAIATFDR